MDKGEGTCVAVLGNEQDAKVYDVKVYRALGEACQQCWCHDKWGEGYDRQKWLREGCCKVMLYGYRVGDVAKQRENTDGNGCWQNHG